MGTEEVQIKQIKTNKYSTWVMGLKIMQSLAELLKENYNCGIRGNNLYLNVHY